MTSAVLFFESHCPVARDVTFPDFNHNFGPETVAVERLSTESIGTFTLTLTNVVVGSVVRVETQVGGVQLALTTAASSTVVLLIDAFVLGSPNNDLRIKVRKGSAPYYKNYETQATAFVGSQSIFIAQIPD